MFQGQSELRKVELFNQNFGFASSIYWTMKNRCVKVGATSAKKKKCLKKLGFELTYIS